MGLFHILPSSARWVVPGLAALAVLALPAPSEVPRRQNALRKLSPGAAGALSPDSRRQAAEFITGWMRAFSVLGVSGLARETMRASAEREVLASLNPLEDGTATEKAAYRAGLKANEALAYLGTRLAGAKPFDNGELNALLRYQPGCEGDPARLASGVAELFMDYAELVDPANSGKALGSGPRPGAPPKGH